jgi:hypothetical protein
MTNGSVHNFRKGEFGVNEIIVDEKKQLIEIFYLKKEIGEKRVFIPFNNIEKCEYLEKLDNMEETM